MTDRSERVNEGELRQRLLSLAEVIRKLDEDGELLAAAPRIMRILGDLRSQLFEYEVRHTYDFYPDEDDIAEVVEARRIVRDAVERMEKADEERWDRLSNDAEDDD